MTESAGTPSLPPRAWRTSLRRRLLDWYRESARDLPWRRDPEPYRVWVSEVMLQQTQVDTVLPYFDRFLARFPSIATLAAAPEDEVLAAWEGLGYYRRARQLRSAAQVVVERHGGRFPDRFESALALPGIGRYTAGAILSIAHDQAHAAVDGNVARLFARLLAEEGEAEGAGARFWALAEALVPRRDPGIWNQALMELGALICTPRRPDCVACPLVGLCAARAAGREEAIPRPRRRRTPPRVEVAVAFVRRRAGGLAMVRRPAGGVLGGFYELPAVDVPPGADPEALLEAALVALGGARVEVGRVLGRVRHTMFSRRASLTAYATRATWTGGSSVVEMGRAELDRHPITTASRKLLEVIGRESRPEVIGRESRPRARSGRRYYSSPRTRSTMS